MLYILFGLPGAGKTFTGNIFQKNFGFYFYDGDALLPGDMREAIHTQKKVTDAMRDRFFASILRKIEELKSAHTHLVIAQTYIKEKYRQQVLKKFPDAQFVLIENNDPIRSERLLHQNTYPLTLAYVRKMVANFDAPNIPHRTITNNSDGEEELLAQVRDFLQMK